MTGARPVYCSFCGCSDRETEVMIAGPVLVFICEECVSACVEAIARKRKDSAYTADVVRCAFCSPAPIQEVGV